MDEAGLIGQTSPKPSYGTLLGRYQRTLYVLDEDGLELGVATCISFWEEHAYAGLAQGYMEASRVALQVAMPSRLLANRPV